jgi:hypothetical protein
MRTATKRESWVTNLAEEVDTPLFVKSNGQQYQPKMSRALSSGFFEEKLHLLLSGDMCMAVNFFNPMTREYMITHHHDGEQGLQRLLARIYCQDPRTQKKKEYKTFNRDHTTMVMRANSKDNSLNCYSVESSWPALGMQASKLSNFSNVPPNLANHRNRNLRRIFFCYNAADHHNEVMATKKGHPFSAGKVVNLAKNLGLPCCKKHPYGCGRSLRVSNIVKVDTSHCLLLNNIIWVVPVKVWNGAGFGCIVGFVKVIFDQLDLVGNRLAVVKRINFDDFNYETQAAAAAPWIGKCCHGVVEAFFLDGVHAGCSKDILDDDHQLPGRDFKFHGDDPNDEDSVDEDEGDDGDEASA